MYTFYMCFPLGLMLKQKYLLVNFRTETDLFMHLSHVGNVYSLKRTKA